jgi:hypothetical protein
MVQVLSEDAVKDSLDEETKMCMERIYQNYQRRFQTIGNEAWAPWYMTTTADLTSKLWSGFEILRSGGTKDTLRWFKTSFHH